jgi:hypothetical protein
MLHDIMADGAEVTVHSIHGLAVQPPNAVDLINTPAELLLLLSLLMLLPLLLPVHAVSIHPASSAA